MKTKRRGIILVSILVLTLLATFFIGALVQMNPSRLRRTVHDEKRDRAAMAAKAGVDYVLNRCKSQLDWKPSPTETRRVVEMDELVILEDRGNVLGWIKVEGGEWAGFRIRFNHQDGPIGGTASPYDDNMNNPTYLIESPGISLSKLEPLGSPSYPNAIVGDGSDYSPTGTAWGMPVPDGTIGLIVEGVVHPDLDPNTPDTLASVSGGTVRTLEGLYKVAHVSEGLDADSFLNGWNVNSIHPDGVAGAGFHLTSDNDVAARIRTKEGFSIANLSGSSPDSLFQPDQDAEVLTGATNPFSMNGLVGGVELPDDPFLRIQYDQVEDSGQASPNQLQGGVYIIKRGHLDNASRNVQDDVVYYDMTWDAYRTAKINGDPLPAPKPLPTWLANSINLDGKDVTVGGVATKRDTIVIDKDIDVVASDTGINDISIIPERGARQKAGGDDTGGDVVDPTEPVPPTTEVSVADAGLSNGIIGDVIGVVNTNIYVLPGPHGSGVNFHSNGVFHPAQGPGRLALYNYIGTGASFDITAPNQGTVSALQSAIPYATFTDNGGTITVSIDQPGAALAYTGGGGGGGTAGPPDDLHIPYDDDPLVNNTDETVPQDIEIVFDPGDGADTAFIRSDGDIFLGTHISGEKGGVVAGGDIDMVGFGVDLQAVANQEIAGVAIYGQNDINISTYDERVNEYHDVNLAGLVYTEGNIFMRLGEELFSGDKPTRYDGTVLDDPEWGTFSLRGAIVALGGAPYYDGEIEFDTTGGQTNNGAPGFANNNHPTGPNTAGGDITVYSQRFNGDYDPSFVAPYIQDSVVNPTFAPVSVNIR